MGSWRWRAVARLLAISLLVGQNGMASGPNPSLNPPTLSPSSMSAPLSSSSASLTDATGGAGGGATPSPDNSPSPSMRLRSPRQGILIPDHFPTINQAFHAAKSPDVLTVRSGRHEIGEDAIKGGQFHNNQPCYYEPQILINKKLLIQGDVTGSEKPVVRGKTVLQQPVHPETWNAEEGGGALELMTLCWKDADVHGFCIAIEGGSWLVEECEVRCTGEFSKGVWVYGGHYVFDDSYKGGGRVVDEYAGADAMLKRSTIGGFCEGGTQGSVCWGVLTWQLAKVTVEDCLIEDAEVIGISVCHASLVHVLGSTVQGCGVGALLVNEEGRLTVESCLLRDNKCALVAGKEANDASMHLIGNVVHGRLWHHSWGGQMLEADKDEELGDGQPLFLGTWTDRGRIPDPDPTDVERYVRRVRRNTWSRAPVRLTRADAEQMGLDPAKKVVSTVVGRPGTVIEEHNQYLDGDEEEDLVGIGVALNVTSKGEVVVVGLLVGHPAQTGGVEVGDVIFSLDGAPVWLPEDVVRRCAGPVGTSVKLGLLRGPYRGEIEITITRRLIGRMPLSGPSSCANLWPGVTAQTIISSQSPIDARKSDPLDMLEHPEDMVPHAPDVLRAAQAQAASSISGNFGGGGGGSMTVNGGAGAYGDGGEGVGGEGVADEGLESVGGVLMRELQRDPWASPPPEIDNKYVYPERWGSASFGAGWGRAAQPNSQNPTALPASNSGALSNGLAEQPANNLAIPPTHAPTDPAWRPGGEGGGGRDAFQGGTWQPAADSGLIGPTTRPTDPSSPIYSGPIISGGISQSSVVSRVASPTDAIAQPPLPLMPHHHTTAPPTHGHAQQTQTQHQQSHSHPSSADGHGVPVASLRSLKHGMGIGGGSVECGRDGLVEGLVQLDTLAIHLTPSTHDDTDNQTHSNTHNNTHIGTRMHARNRTDTHAREGRDSESGSDTHQEHQLEERHTP